MPWIVVSVHQRSTCLIDLQRGRTDRKLCPTFWWTWGGFLRHWYRGLPTWVILILVFFWVIHIVLTSCILMKETKLFLIMTKFIKWSSISILWKASNMSIFFMLHFQRHFLELKFSLFHRIIKFTLCWLLSQNIL